MLPVQPVVETVRVKDIGNIQILQIVLWIRWERHLVVTPLEKCPGLWVPLQNKKVRSYLEELILTIKKRKWSHDVFPSRFFCEMKSSKFSCSIKIQATGRVTVPKSPVRWRCFTQNFLKKWFLVCALCYLFPKPWIFPRKKNWKQNWYAEFVISLRNKNDITMKKDRKSQNQPKKKRKETKKVVRIRFCDLSNFFSIKCLQLWSNLKPV